ncbi:MAG: MOSC domain-containing protein [Alphaproteobacteria bacterium]|jgi:MOSC domain-containing protein YiiM
MSGQIVAVCGAAGNVFKKTVYDAITLVEALGVEDDAHNGVTVQHLYLKNIDATAPNLRQVHLIQSELFDYLSETGFDVGPGDLGENVTTAGIALTDLPAGTRIHIGDACVELTGLRNPCKQIDGYQRGLTKAVTARNADGRAHLKFGVMGIVVGGGEIKPGAAISVELPPAPHSPLQPV